MIESPKGMKERYCRMRNGWVGNMLCCSAWEQKANTNADKIRAMTDEELAEFSDKSFLCPPSIHGKCDHIENDDQVTPKICLECWREWLKAEAVE